MKITISGLSGCGSTTACNNVAKTLNLSVINYTFRNLSADLKIPFEQLQNDASKNPDYDYFIDKNLITLADKSNNCVIASRLAGWLFDDANLRVWLSASIETRAKRIASRESKNISDVINESLVRDEQNWNRYKKLYGVDVNDHEGFDIIVNTEYLTAQQVSALIVAAANLASENNLYKPIKAATRIREILEEKTKNSSFFKQFDSI